MTIGVVRETAPGETRVALVPGDVPALITAAGAVSIEAGAGLHAGYPDDEYAAKGATISDRSGVLGTADCLLTVRSAAANGGTGVEDVRAMKRGAALVGFLEPYAPHPSFAAIAESGLRAFSMERIPRITRAQSMDALSSQANLAGYRAVLVAAQDLPRAFPMMMTAAGTVVPARVFIVGVGVAGLQAIATARRLGAVVSAYDIRPAVKEQVESLGARFVEMDLETESSETSGGYARAMDDAFYARQRELMASVVADSDVVITTAAVPGKRAPVLITEAMVHRMRPGSVVVDLAAERGGNCDVTRPGETVYCGASRVIGVVNVPSSIAYHASQLYSRNITTFVRSIVTEGEFSYSRDDEVVAATLVIENGHAPDAEIASVLQVAATSEGEEA